MAPKVSIRVDSTPFWGVQIPKIALSAILKSNFRSHLVVTKTRNRASMLTNVDKKAGFRGFHFFWWGMIAPSPSCCGTAGHVRGRTHRIRWAGGHIDPFVHALFTLRSEGIRKPLHCHPSDRRSTEASASPGARRRLPRLFSSHTACTRSRIALSTHPTQPQSIWQAMSKT